MPKAVAICLLGWPRTTWTITSRSRRPGVSKRARTSVNAVSFSRRERSLSKPSCIASSRSWSRNGLVRNSIEPPFIACTDHGDIDVSSNEDDWECYICNGELALKVETAFTRQPDVKDCDLPLSFSSTRS
jgi:hypothetical protein